MSGINITGRKYTPENIVKLPPKHIFVFGSNEQGMHGAGAAKFAVDTFGAIYGQGEGLQGQSYAIPTMEGINNMRNAIMRFLHFADTHPKLTFYVTKIGCGIAGYQEDQVAPFFDDVPKNVVKPKGW